MKILGISVDPDPIPSIYSCSKCKYVYKLSLFDFEYKVCLKETDNNMIIIDRIYCLFMEHLHDGKIIDDGA